MDNQNARHARDGDAPRHPESTGNAALLNAEVRVWSDARQNPPKTHFVDHMRLGFRPANFFFVNHSIYYAGAGHIGHSYWRVNWSQNYLSELGDETGGEAYWQGFNSPVSFDPYLKDLTERLQNQYLMTLVSDDTKGGLEPVRVTTSVSGVSLVAASKIDTQTGH